MTEAPSTEPLQESSELTFMKSKFSGLKQKLGQPFPYFYSLAPKDQLLYNEKLAEIKNKIKENPQLPDHKDIFQAMALGRIQGMPATLVPVDELSKHFQFENKQFWAEVTKQKVAQKFYGLPKQKSHGLWEIKDIETLKELFNIQQIKKQRKIVKQYSNFYKAGCKFVQKFDKIKTQADVMEAYEQYKKVEQQDSKMNKILTTQKNKSIKVTLPQIPAEIPQKSQKPQQKQNEQKKLQASQQQPQITPSTTPNQNPNPTQKPPKKKAQPKDQPSNKKQNKITNEKQQQILSKQKQLDFFFKKKQPEPQELNKEAEVEGEEKIDKTDAFIAMLGFNKDPCETVDNLKEQFRSFKKKMDYQIKICYASINMLRSRIELENFPVKELKADFLDPFSEKQNIRYDDSSDEYSQLVADSINEQMVQEQQEQEQEESNSAIVSDSFCQYKSSHILSSSESSDEQQEIKVKPQIVKSIQKWFFSSKDVEKRQKFAKYDIVCLEDAFPIIVKDQAQENSNEITSTQKVQMYKQIHGSYTPKQLLIKKLNTIVENKISMNKLSTLIKDICEKKGTQRILKTEIIRQLAEQLNQAYPNLQAELQQLRNEREIARNIQTQAKREQKMNERDQKIQKLILEYQGEISTSSLLQYLRSNQVKILKQQLNSTIKTKQGQKWQSIRTEIKKSKLLKKSRTKKIKPAKNQQEEQLLNSHRPIDEILRQNQIDNMNKPKKEKKQKKERKEKVGDSGKMVDQGEGQGEIQEEEEEYRDPSDDQSFQLQKKRKQKSKKSKNKRIVKINPLLPPVRRNPKRNKAKSKKQKLQNKQQQAEQQLDQNVEDQAENSQKDQNKNSSMSDQKEEEREQEQGQELVEKMEVEEGNGEEQNKEEVQEEGKHKGVQLENQVVKENSSPVRVIQEAQKKDEVNIEKTANKIGQTEQGNENN